MLQVKDCGSVGGFDKKNPIVIKSGFNLYDRFIALVNKHNNDSDIEKGLNFNLNTLCEYFKTLINLRENFLKTNIK